MKEKTVYVKKLALFTVFSALGVVLSPFFWFVFLGTKAFPTQHMINAILGVFLGPLWAAVAAILIGTIRYMLGVGTLFAFPGGIPGGIAVGITYWVLKRLGTSEKKDLMSALAEPIGTLLVGAPLALFLVAPWIGAEPSLTLIGEKGLLLALLVFSTGWALSCVLGSVLGFLILLFLNRVGLDRETLFGDT